jgi:hypothetical protein
MVTNGSVQLPRTLPPMRRIVKGRAMIMGQTFHHETLVTPAKAGVHHLTCKFQRRVMDSRLRGNDEVGDGNNEVCDWEVGK